MKQPGHQYPVTVKSIATHMVVCQQAKSVVCCALKLADTSYMIMTSCIGVHRDKDKLLSTHEQTSYVKMQD